MLDRSRRLSFKSRLLTYQTTTSTIKHSPSKQNNQILTLRKNHSLTIKLHKDNIASSSPQKYIYNSLNKNTYSVRKSNNIYWHKSIIYNSITVKNQQKYLTQKQKQKPQIFCSSLYAKFIDTKQSIIEKECNQKRQIASLTKIMTAFTVINICSIHGIKIRQTYVTVQRQASIMQGTSANLRNGDKLLIIDLLYGLLLPSGNDAALALAQYFGKFLSFTYSNKKSQTIEKVDEKINQFQEMKDFYDSEYRMESIRLFVFQMNKNCPKIGLKNTRFSNPTGLSDKNNYSTAYQLSKLIQFCLHNYLLRSIFKKKVYTCIATNEKMGTKRTIQWRNTNKHLFMMFDCIGVKTGITPGAGPCLSSAYKIKGKQLIVIILNSKSIEDRYNDALKIYHYAKSLVMCEEEDSP